MIFLSLCAFSVSLPSMVFAATQDDNHSNAALPEDTLAPNLDLLALQPEVQKENLITWLTGEFSNLRHVFEFGPTGGYPPLLMRQQQVNLMNDEAAIYTEQSWLAAPEQIYRKHLYRFRILRSSNDIVQDVYLVPNDFSGELYDEEGIADELELVAGCSIRWQATEQGFKGYRDGNRCSFRDENNQIVSWTTHLTLNQTEYTVADSAFTDNGEQVLGDIDGNALVLNRIRFFQAEIGYLPAGADPDVMEEWMVALPQRPLHDHEQRIPLLSADDGLFLGHEVQIVSDIENPQKLQIRLYRQTEEEPMLQMEMDYKGDGKWSATAERLRIQLSMARSITELQQH